LTSVQIDENLHVVVGGGFPFCNSLVIIGNEIVVVDPGCPLDGMRAFLKTHDLQPRDIDLIILSHIHPDHITHTMKLHRLSSCKIAANEITAPLFDEKEEMKKFLGFNKENPVRHLWEDLVNTKMYGVFDEGHVDIILKDSQEYTTGDITLKMLYTPGHLPDHMCMEILESNYIFGADIDCTSFGPYYGHPNCSISDFKKSIQVLRMNNYSGLISGHLEQPIIEDYKPALDEYESYFDAREEKLYQIIQNGASTIEEVLFNPIIYPPLSNPVFLQFERWMIEHHIQSLEESGLIEEESGKLIAIDKSRTFFE
jgi:glyoxylase-like metal-dependent hydrolase (beta-lactamase superfamily II)